MRPEGDTEVMAGARSGSEHVPINQAQASVLASLRIISYLRQSYGES